jgi:hypothetical protein
VPLALVPYPLSGFWIHIRLDDSNGSKFPINSKKNMICSDTNYELSKENHDVKTLKNIHSYCQISVSSANEGINIRQNELRRDER